MTTNDTQPRYQAWITVGYTEIEAEPRYSQREARADADKLFADHNGTCRAVVLDMQHRSVGSLASCVYLLTPAE